MSSVLELPRIESIRPITLIGMSITTTYSPEKISGLFQQFMPRRGEISNASSDWIYSMHTYPQGREPEIFSFNQVFEKWVGIEVSDFDVIPDGMKSYEMSGGLYAIFIHHGPVTGFSSTLEFIYKEWMPESGYELDSREHFEILTEKYLGPMNPESVEDVYIPIRKVTEY